MRAQDLSGTWQGVEVHPPLLNYWPAVLTLSARPGAAPTGVLYQEVGNRPEATGTFEMGGTRTAAGLQLDYLRIISEANMGAGSWCVGTIAFTFDAAQEKLTGRSVFKPVGSCSTSRFELFRVRLKSPAAVPPNGPCTLVVSGRDVRWFADPQMRQLLATGNSYRTSLTKTTTFYLAQDFYPSAHRAVVPITILVEAVVKKQKAAAPKPATTIAAVPALVLPAVLFRQGTAELLPEASPALQALANKLRERPLLRLRITGHTDRIGEAQKNLVLSEQRAQAVRAHLMQHGIAASRLTAVGYGDTRLLFPSPDARNRRVAVEEIN